MKYKPALAALGTLPNMAEIIAIAKNNGLQMEDLQIVAAALDELLEEVSQVVDSKPEAHLFYALTKIRDASILIQGSTYATKQEETA